MGVAAGQAPEIGVAAVAWKAEKFCKLAGAAAGLAHVTWGGAAVLVRLFDRR